MKFIKYNKRKKILYNVACIIYTSRVNVYKTRRKLDES
jgi:hypothetical protein